MYSVGSMNGIIESTSFVNNNCRKYSNYFELNTNYFQLILYYTLRVVSVEMCSPKFLPIFYIGCGMLWSVHIKKERWS